jgi:hypothetical protein
MATRTSKTTPAKQSDDFFNSVQLATFVKPKWAYQAADPMDKARDSIIAAIEKQLDILAGKAILRVPRGTAKHRTAFSFSGVS